MSPACLSILAREDLGASVASATLLQYVLHVVLVVHNKHMISLNDTTCSPANDTRATLFVNGMFGLSAFENSVFALPLNNGFLVGHL